MVFVVGAGGLTFFGTLEYGSVSFGGTTFSTNRTRCLIAKLDLEGHHLWSQQYSASEYTYCRDSAIDPQGNILITGDAELTGPVDSPGKWFLRSLDPSGVVLWSKAIQDSYTTAEERGYHVTADAGGNVLASGAYEGGLDLGGGQVRGGSFLAKFDAQGNHVWSKGLAVAPSVSTNALGEVLVSGTFSGSLALGDGFTLQSAGATDLFLAKLTP